MSKKAKLDTHSQTPNEAVEQREGHLSEAETLDLSVSTARSAGADPIDSVVDAEQPARSQVNTRVAEIDPRAAFKSAPGEAPAQTRIKLLQELKGRYTPAEELGKGGIGRVYTAYDEQLKRQVAIKELLNQPSGRASTEVRNHTEQRFIREALVTGQLQHPSVVSVYELGERDDGSVYYTMQVVRGRTLSDLIYEEETLAERLKHLGAVLSLVHAIAYAHDKGVIHRDLKPSNVMLGEFGETVVLDWGLAKVRGVDEPDLEAMGQSISDIDEEDLAATVAGELMGTPSYMSPEQARGEIDSINERSDVYSLGVILFELITGRLPFEASNVFALVQKVRKEQAPPVLEVLREGAQDWRIVGADLAAIIDKACAFSPEDRYASASELAKDLRAFIEGRQVSVYSYGSRELLRRFFRRNKGLSLALIGLFLALIFGGTLSYWQARNAEAARQRAEAAHGEARASEAVALQAKQEAEEEKLKGEEERLEAIRALSRGHAERARQLIKARRLLEARVFVAAAMRTSGAHPRSKVKLSEQRMESQDAQRERANLRSLYAESESGLQRVAKWSLPSMIRTMKFSPDNQVLAALLYDGQVRLFDLKKRRALAPVREEGMAHGLTFVPGGPRLAYISDNSSPELVVYDYVEHTFLPRVPLPSAITPQKGEAYSLDWGAEDEVFVSAMRQGVFKINKSGALQAAWRPTNPSIVLGIERSPDGKHLLVHLYQEVAILDAENLSELQRWRVTENEEINSACFVGDDKIATAVVAPNAQLWSIEGEHLGELDSGSLVFSVSEGGGRILSKGYRAMLFSAQSLEPIEALPDRGGQINRSAVSLDGQWVASTTIEGLGEGGITIWHVQEERTLYPMPHFDLVQEHGYLHSNHTLFAITMNPQENLHLWRASGEPMEAWLDEGEQAVEVVEIERNGGVEPMLLVQRVSDGCVFSRPLERASESRALGCLGPAIYGYKGTLVSCGRAGSCGLLNEAGALEIWDLTTGELKETFQSPISLGYGVTLSPSGRFAALTDWSGQLFLYDLELGTLASRSVLHGGVVSGVSFAQNDTMMATSSADERATLWRLPDHSRSSLEEIRTLKGHDEWINRVVFSNDGSMVVTVSDDHSAKLWRTDGTLLQTIPLPAHAVSAAFAPGKEGERLLLAFPEGLRTFTEPSELWSLDPEALQAEAELAAGVQLKGVELIPTSVEKQEFTLEPFETHSAGKLVALEDWFGRGLTPADKLDVLSLQGAPSEGRAKLDEAGQELLVSLPEGLDAFILRVDIDGVVTSLLSPTLARGARFSGAAITRLWLKREAQRRDIPHLSEDEVWLVAEVSWGEGRTGKVEPLPCARVSIKDQDAATLSLKGEHQTGPKGEVFVRNVQPGTPLRLKIEVGGVAEEFEIPGLPGGSVGRLNLVFDSEKHPVKPACER